MGSTAEQAYLDLKADDRLEVRLPSLLKQHAELVANAKHRSVSEFVLAVLAEAVNQGLAEVGAWKLTIPEQVELLQVLAQPATYTPGMTAARKRADELFGPNGIE